MRTWALRKGFHGSWATSVLHFAGSTAVAHSQDASFDAHRITSRTRMVSVAVSAGAHALLLLGLLATAATVTMAVAVTMTVAVTVTVTVTVAMAVIVSMAVPKSMAVPMTEHCWCGGDGQRMGNWSNKVCLMQVTRLDLTRTTRQEHKSVRGLHTVHRSTGAWHNVRVMQAIQSQN